MSTITAIGPSRSTRWPSLWSAALVVGGLTATAKVVALFKDSLVAARFGNGAELDAFLLALVVPGFLISVAAGTLPAALTPTYIAVREREGVEAARVLTRAVFAHTIRWLALAAIVAGVASLAYSTLPGSRLAPATREALPTLAMWLAPYTLLQGICAAWSGLLAAERGYAASALAPIAQPIGMALALFIGDRSLGVGLLVGGLLGGTLVQGAIFAVALHARGLPLLVWRVPPTMSASTRAALARVRAQYAPAVAGAVLMSATSVVDQTMATWLPPGSVSALGFGTKLSAVMMSVGAIALSTTLLPHLSELVAREDWPAIRLLERRVARLILGTTIPVTIVLIAAADPIVRLLFQRGAFTAAETATVATVQSAYLLQLPVHLLGILYVRLISALQANRLLSIGSAVNLAVNIALNVVFMRWFGVAGIALSTAGVYALSCVFLATAAHRRLAHAERDSQARFASSPAAPASPAEGRCASAA
ncbi:MAG: polysaccharide biosynthesis C-terminal domain-containing protein [Gemmatimonadaceae bacterium]|nr:polysaccharide biosynthesis C-terminal domain-containing protein [Gemmatimonadaceae bacterium]